MGDILFFLRAATSYAHSLVRLANANQTCRFENKENQTELNCSCLDTLDKKRDQYSWVLELMDSFGKLPSGILEGNFFFLGSYEQCFAVTVPKNKYQPNLKWSGKYCRADMATYLQTGNSRCSASPGPTKNRSQTVGNPFHRECSTTYVIRYGLCAPESCTKEDITTILEMFLKPVEKTVRCSLNVICHEKELQFRNDPKAIFMFTFTLFVATIVLFGTMYDYFVYSDLAKALPESKTLNKSSHGEQTLTKSDFYNGQSWFIKVLLAFSLYTNIPRTTDMSKKAGQIDCLHGVRVLSMTWVMLGHCYYWGIKYFDNLKAAFDLPQYFLNQLLLNASMCVDSFYVLSAMLLVYLWFKRMTKEKGKNVYSLSFWANYIIHRYIRLTPVYMIILGMDVCLFRYLTDGPMWNQDGIEPNYCRNSWWTNMLYLNNFVNLYELCMSWTWYLANDMQFYAVAPLFLILLWKYRYEILGVIAIVGATLASGIIKAAVIMQHKNWPPVSIFTVSPEQFTITDAYWDTLYVKPYIRCKPFLVGMLLGYILFKWGLDVKLPKWAVFTGWCSAFAAGFGVIFGLYDFSRTNYITNVGNVLYAVFGRTLWAAALSWVIYACTTGYGGPVNRFLSWKVWKPFSRITYCAYLVHPLLILGYYSSRQRPVHFGSHYQMINYHIAHVIFGYTVAFVLSLMFEVPVMWLEQLVFKRKSSADDSGSKIVETEKTARGFENPNLTRSPSPTGEGSNSLTPTDPVPPGTAGNIQTPMPGTPILRTPSTRSAAQ